MRRSNFIHSVHKTNENLILNRLLDKLLIKIRYKICYNYIREDQINEREEGVMKLISGAHLFLTNLRNFFKDYFRLSKKQVKTSLIVFLPVFLIIISFQNCEYKILESKNLSSRAQNPPTPTLTNPEPGMSLHEAAKQGRLDVVEYHVTHKGADVNAKNQGNFSPLFYAVVYDHLDVVKYLVSQGADMASGDGQNNIPLLHYAANLGYVEIVKHLVSQGADVNGTAVFPYKTINNKEYFMYNTTPLFAAVTTDSYPMKPTPFYTSPSYVRDRISRKAQIVKLLVDSNANINARIELSTDQSVEGYDSYKHHYTLLHWVVRNDYDLDIVRSLVDSGINVDLRNNLNNTPLHFAVQFAAKYEHLDMVKYLVSQGAEINASVNSFVNVLYWASRFGYQPIVEYLVDQEVDINALKDSLGNSTSLYAASRSGSISLFEYLIDQGAEINEEDSKTYNSFLYITCDEGDPLDDHLDMVKYMVIRGANVNTYAPENLMTVLHVASKKGLLEVVKYLVENEDIIKESTEDTPEVKKKKANINPKDSDGKTPLDYAKEEGHTDVVTYLESQGAESGSPSTNTVSGTSNGPGINSSNNTNNAAIITLDHAMQSEAGAMDVNGN